MVITLTGFLKEIPIFVRFPPICPNWGKLYSIFIMNTYNNNNNSGINININIKTITNPE